jgi:hypothetical protein
MTNNILLIGYHSELLAKTKKASIYFDNHFICLEGDEKYMGKKA